MILLEKFKLQSSIWFFLILLVIFSGCAMPSAPNPKISEGKVFITTDQHGEIPLLALDGHWEFYWKNFLYHSDLKKGSKVRPDLMARVPHVWNKDKTASEKFTANGYATYRLRVNLPNDYFDAAPSYPVKQMGIYIETISTAWALYINDKKIAFAGKTGTSRYSSIPKERPQAAYFTPPGRTFDIIIHASNFHHSRGGLWNSVLFGTAESIKSRTEEKLALQFFLLGGLLIMAFYHFIMYLLRKNELSHIYFSGVSFLFACRNLLTGERIITELVPSLSYQSFMKLSYLDTYLSVPFFIIFLHTLFPDEIKKPVYRGAFIVAGFFSAVVLFTPVSVFSHTLFFYEIFILLCIIPVFIFLIEAKIHKREGAVIILGGAIFFSTIVIMAIMNHQRILYFPGFAPLGFMIFLIIHSFLLSKKFSRSFTATRKLSRELEGNNIDLINNMKELKDTQEKLVLQEKRAATGKMAAGLARVIRNQLESVSKLTALKEKITPEEKISIQYIFDSRERIISLLDEVKAIAGNEDIHYIMNQEPLNALIEEAVTLIQLDPDVNDKNIEIHNYFDGSLYCNRNKLMQVLFNLIRNAAQAIADSRDGTINITAAEMSTSILIEISDNGIGIPPEKIESIWEPFFSTKGESGTGIGLSITKNIVERHGGTITCSSKKGEKTIFRMSFPRKES